MTDDELALWREANVRWYGIDCKRPFGTGNVSRDMRAIVDPSRELKQAAFSKLRKQLESRLILFLQFFVQYAVLEPGPYHRGENALWEAVPKDYTPSVETIDICEWRSRTYLPYHYDGETFTETLSHLNPLVWDNRVEGTFAEIMERFKLDNVYGGYLDRKYEGDLLDQTRTGLTSFSSQDCECCMTFLAVATVRMLNARALFDEALQVLGSQSMLDIEPDAVDWTEISVNCIAVLERLVALHGSGKLPYNEFQSIYCDMHSDWDDGKDGTLAEFISKVLNDIDQIDDAHNGDWYSTVAAVCRQLELMNGGYDDTFQPKHC